MNILADIDIIDTRADNRAVAERVDRHGKLSVLASVQWSSACMQHTDEILLDDLDAGRDLFPPEIGMQLPGKARDDTLACNINGDDAVPPWDAGRLHTVRPEDFDCRFRKHMILEPRAGRFYPRGVFSGIPDNSRSDMRPCRLVEVRQDALVTDFNHPLARHECTLELAVLQAWQGDTEQRGRSNDIVEMCTAAGPGMQARWQDSATDFAGPDAFTRADPSPDDEFYLRPRMVHHLDAACRRHLTSLYADLLPQRGDILDLMSSWTSHLPATHGTANVRGLGMNRQELDANPVLNGRIVHDLNRDATLPFTDASFDAAVCTASVEYLLSPHAVFAELARVLRPGAPLVIAFSNRWFPSRAIQLWGMSHDFEHMGLVAEYLYATGAFERLHSWSLRKLPRPRDDKYADRLPHADPVFAIWAYRQ